MTTYPPTPTPPEPERPDEEGGDGGGGREPSPGGEPGGPRPFSGNQPGPTPPGETPGERSAEPPDEPTEPSPEPFSAIPPAPPPPEVGAGGGSSPYAGGAVPPPPPPPAWGGEGTHPGQQARNGLGTAALVCGIIAVVVSFIPVLNWFTWPVGVLAIVFGAVGWSRANKGQATNKKAAIAGLVLGIASFFTFCLIYIIIGAGGGSSMYYDVSLMP